MFRSAKKLVYLSVVALCLNVGFAHAGNVIFDLGGVCFDTSKMSAFWHIKTALARCPHRLVGAKVFVFDFLEPLMSYENGAFKPHRPGGKPLPRIMDARMKGDITSAYAMQLVERALAQDTTKSAADKRLLKVMCEFILTPELLVKSQQLVDEAVDFVQECKDKGHNVYILSNWDSESFDLVYSLHPEFFDLFDGIVISGDVGANKPDPAIYNFLLKEYNLDPRECVFLDDQKANIDAAELLGIKGIHVTRKRRFMMSYIDFKRMRRRFDIWERSLQKQTRTAIA